MNQTENSEQQKPGFSPLGFSALLGVYSTWADRNSMNSYSVRLFSLWRYMA